MRKGALKKRKRQLEELLLDRREALGELVLGMYVQNSWDDDLLARGSAEVAEVDNELSQLTAEAPAKQAAAAPAPVEPETAEHTGEHEFPETGEHTGEHDYPATGEHTAEQDLATGEYTGEHDLPTGDHLAGGTGSQDERDTPGEPVKPPVKAEAAGAAPPPAATAAPTPSATAPTPSATSAPPATAPGTGAEPPVAASTGPAVPATAKPQEGAAKPQEATDATPDNRLDRTAKDVEERERRARTAAEAARASLAADSQTELTAIIGEVESERKQLDQALATAAASITASEKRATEAEESAKKRIGEAEEASKKKIAEAEARMASEAAANREAATEWVRSQSAEIEADAALAAEIAAGEAGEQGAPPPPPPPGAAAAVDSPEANRKITALQAELAAEKAAKAEALANAEARLKSIEDSAREAEERVAKAEQAAKAETPAHSEAETREAAVDWLRGQIAALRQEIHKGAAAGQEDGS
ncbi:MAG: hypothetical protein KDB62_01525 [Solirubrobacterales bacterium]|nr:hypothetical protein [Solirubrobacterales bacterium]